MAIGYRELSKLVDSTFKDYIHKEGYTFCELGNNYIKKDCFDWLEEKNFNLEKGGQQRSNGIVSKKFWEAVGFDHTSIDLNGLDGSLQVDLRKDAPEEFLNRYDIIYDGGTGEHVNNQYKFFQNCHNMVKEGGLMVHILPKEGYFPKHCSYYYNLDSFEKLIELNNYEQLELFEHDAAGGLMIYAAFRKVNNEPFIDEETFCEVPIVFTQYQANDKGLYPYAYR